MKILIVTSTAFYSCVKPLAEDLLALGHEVLLPNCIDNAKAEFESLEQGKLAEFKQERFV